MRGMRSSCARAPRQELLLGARMSDGGRQGVCKPTPLVLAPGACANHAARLLASAGEGAPMLVWRRAINVKPGSRHRPSAVFSVTANAFTMRFTELGLELLPHCRRGTDGTNSKETDMTGEDNRI